MLGNGIKQTTATTGTGNLTVAAVVGYPALSNVLAIGQPFAYTLLDAAGLFLEAGIGYLSDAATLVRARISATFSGGVYNAANPTALSLTGTTTIICTPHAASLESMPATVDSQSSGIGRWVTCAGRTGQQSPSAISPLRVYYLSFLLKTGAPINALMLTVSTPGTAGAVARIGIHPSNEKGYIGPLIVTTSDLDMASTGNKAGTFAPVNLPPGRYVTSCVFSTSVTVGGYTSAHQNVIGGQPFGMTAATPPVAIDFRYETVVSAVIPPVPSLTTSFNAVGAAHPPMVFMGVV